MSPANAAAARVSEETDRVQAEYVESAEDTELSNRVGQVPGEHPEVDPAGRVAREQDHARDRPATAPVTRLVPADLSSMSDQDLLEGIRAESEAHFAELYNRYFQRIYNFVFARMRNHAETEEVVQETFLAVYRSIENYRGQSSLLSWTYGIAKNTTNNSLRRAKSQHERIDLADDEDLMPRPSLDVGSPDEQLDLRRFREHLRERLGSLASWQAEIFEMRHFENLSIPEISARTSRSSDAVRSCLYRVKRIFFDAAANGGASLPSGAVAGGES